MLVRAPGATEFTPLEGKTPLTSGTEVDVRSGVAVLTVAAQGGGRRAKRVRARSGRFVFRQRGAANSTAWLALSDQLDCSQSGSTAKRLLDVSVGRARPSASDRVGAAGRVAKGKGKGKGKRRKPVVGTQGKFASGTVRGTGWRTTDRCKSTTLSVSAGKVRVRDLVRGIVRIVKAGSSYTARAG